MKRTLFLLTIVTFGVFTLAGCGNTNANSNTAANKNGAPVSSVLKPGDVSPDKAVKVADLVDGVTADKDAWKDKEVAVTGYVFSASDSGKHQTVSLKDDEKAPTSKAVSCLFEGDKPDVFQKTVEVRGKISSVYAADNGKSVTLEPCVLKK